MRGKKGWWGTQDRSCMASSHISVAPCAQGKRSESSGYLGAEQVVVCVGGGGVKCD
jgi:hypothetical protein